MLKKTQLCPDAYTCTRSLDSRTIFLCLIKKVKLAIFVCSTKFVCMVVECEVILREGQSRWRVRRTCETRQSLHMNSEEPIIAPGRSWQMARHGCPSKRRSNPLLACVSSKCKQLHSTVMQEASSALLFFQLPRLPGGDARQDDSSCQEIFLVSSQMMIGELGDQMDELRLVEFFRSFPSRRCRPCGCIILIYMITYRA